MIPISYETKIKVLHTKIEYSPYQSIVGLDKSLNDLAEEFRAVFFNAINFKRDIRVGDEISIVYEEKLRSSKRVAPPRIKSAFVNMHGKKYYVFFYKNRYYNHKGQLLKKFELVSPSKAKITSSFSLKRFHPILKKYRAHHGIDYGARRNSKIRSALDGKVVFKGWKGGYGRTIILQHGSHYKTLYAHMNKFSPYIYKNKFVKAGSYIGNVGKTGLATGYHLHFGLYKNGRPINPEGFINHGQFNLVGKKLKKFNAYTSKYKDKMLNASYGIVQDTNVALSEYAF
ncbi:Membrane proteins related to metalloendopeptidases [hydrothermal vent metagenome]|uniref:Membrane proteins related to metalloendopeptidases n=1 Tax=hydrothermal vent metagenome TaxID=652676 RepID=A0A3B1E9L2_9ZZZZ